MCAVVSFPAKSIRRDVELIAALSRRRQNAETMPNVLVFFSRRSLVHRRRHRRRQSPGGCFDHLLPLEALHHPPEEVFVQQVSERGHSQRRQVVVVVHRTDDGGGGGVGSRKSCRRDRVAAQHIVERKCRRPQRGAADTGQPAAARHADSGATTERSEQLDRSKSDPLGMLFGRRIDL